MKTVFSRALALVVFAATLACAQDVIPLYQGTPPGSAPENYPEKKYFSRSWGLEVVTNVTKPTLTVFKPVPEQNSDTVAKDLAAKGITAFVLKYRIAHTGEDATEEFNTLLSTDRPKLVEMTSKILPLAIADALTAVTYVRQHASEWGISADRVGIMGFSAGGDVAAGVGFQYKPEGRPAFIAPIYSSARRFKDAVVPADAPPMFIAAATDDQLGLAPDSVILYEKWTVAHKSAELHMFARGGHGFAMRRQNLPTDHWIDRFAEWLDQQGWLKQ